MSEAYLDNCCGCEIPPPCVVLVASQFWYGFERFISSPLPGYEGTLKAASRQSYLTIAVTATWDTSIFGSGGTITLDPLTGNITFKSNESGLGGLNWQGSGFHVNNVIYNATYTQATIVLYEGSGGIPYTITFTLSDPYDIADLYANTVSLLNAQSMAGIPDNNTRTVFYVTTAPYVSTSWSDHLIPNLAVAFPNMSQWAALTTDATETTDHYDIASSGGCPSCLFGQIYAIPQGGIGFEMSGDSGQMTIEKMQIRSQTGHHACQADTFVSVPWICNAHTGTGESTSGRGTQLDNCIIVNESGGNINISECGFDPTVTILIGTTSEQYGAQGCERRVTIGYTPSATASGCPCVPG